MFLGIDVGTQSVKALLYDADRRRVIDVRSAPLQLITAPDGTRACTHAADAPRHLLSVVLKLENVVEASIATKPKQATWLVVHSYWP